MQRARTHRLLLMAYLLTAATFIAPSRSTAQPASRFDGAWSVNLSCESADDGAFGYTWQFTALVVNGILHGEHGQRSGPGWMTLDGTIQPDGSALLVADGLTGDPRYNVGRARPLRPFHYRVSAQFNPPKGTGSRLEVRPCTLAFTKT